jgi:hypothetical protein
MRSFSGHIAVLSIVLSSQSGGLLDAQNAPGNKPRPIEVTGLPPRTAATEYPAHAQVGSVTIGAEFAGHSVPRPDDPLSTEDFVVVEAGLFGSPGARLTLATDDWSLRVNGKKVPLPSQPFVVVASSLRDPQWVNPDEAAQKKSKSSFGTGGGQTDSTPLIVHIPIELQRSMTQYIEKNQMPEGDRPLPQAGLLFFPYRGKTKGIRSLQLIYSGPAGKATLDLQP